MLTGATRDGEVEHDWRALARPGRAFAIYMGIATVPQVRNRLLEAGADRRPRSSSSRTARLSNERAFHTTLRDIDLCVADHALTGPAIIFIGLDWADADLSRPATVVPFAADRPDEDVRWTAKAIAAATHWAMG